MEENVTIPAEEYYDMLGIIFVLNVTSPDEKKGVISTYTRYQDWCRKYGKPINVWLNYGQCYLEMAELRDDFYASYNKYKLPDEFHRSVCETYDRIYNLSPMSLYQLYENFCNRYRIEPLCRYEWAKLLGIDLGNLNETSDIGGDNDGQRRK